MKTIAIVPDMTPDLQGLGKRKGAKLWALGREQPEKPNQNPSARLTGNTSKLHCPRLGPKDYWS